jgi:hypothetical protein
VLSGCLASELSRVLAESNGSGIALGIEYVESNENALPEFLYRVGDHEIPKFMDESVPAYVALVASEAEVRRETVGNC